MLYEILTGRCPSTTPLEVRWREQAARSSACRSPTSSLSAAGSLNPNTPEALEKITYAA